ncbi:Betacarotene 15_15'monooxygenase 1 [Caligus rogercresseyi]|uniref:Betacarotene 15_15'monooxygenase 1 n=1 Tax=Caligus rogercresseyi TaxID=217165 RepID=A0A7T8GYI7_CALRO|nr:Betacarotene 15_15'monooxygenase 1 [Caligus rogercresseyi]
MESHTNNENKIKDDVKDSLKSVVLFTKSSSCSNIRGRLSGQQLPMWVQGVLLYNSPCAGWKNSSSHWMDGLSMMSSFGIHKRGLDISYTKKTLRSEESNRENTTETPVPVDTSEGNAVSIYEPTTQTRFNGGFKKLPSFEKNMEIKDNCNSAFYHFGDLVMATHESAFDRVVDPDFLETRDLIDMSHLFCLKSAVPLKDHNGDYYNLAASMVTGNKYHFIKFKRPSSEVIYGSNNFPSETKFVATIPSRFPGHIGYFHTFGMTDNYLIFCEQPLAYQVDKLKRHKSEGKSFRDCLEWIPQERNHFHIVDKKSGRSLEMNYTTDRPYFFFNFVNCYESGGHLVVDIWSTMGLNQSKIMRFVLPLNYTDEGINLNPSQWGDATAIRRNEIINLLPSVLTRDAGMENPRINPYFNFRRYNYTYVVGWIHGMNPKNPYSNAITKIDVESSVMTSWKTDNEDEHPSEIVFVPNPAWTTEDDGILISCVSNARNGPGSYLVFINARNMQEVARVHFDEAIPFGVHTHFIQRFL